MSQIYKKIRTRQPDIIKTQIGDYAERVVLPKECHSTTFYETLSVYREGKGNEIYYNFSDLRQDPRNIVDYFNKYPEKLKKKLESFEGIKRELRVLIREEGDVRELYKKLILYWGNLAIFLALTNFRNLVKYEKMWKKAYYGRYSDDKIIYDVLDLIYLKIQKIIPEKIKPYIKFIKFEEALYGKFPEISELKIRSKGYIFFKGEILTSENLREIEEKFDIEILEPRIGDIRELKGTVASCGEARGRAKIVFNLNQLSKLEKGDILITPMTTPDFMPFLGKVAGIVTDEGGITCHAAIVSREFSVPCIVGTGIATKIFNDNDFIEVNSKKRKVMKRR